MPDPAAPPLDRPSRRGAVLRLAATAAWAAPAAPAVWAQGEAPKPPAGPASFAPATPLGRTVDGKELTLGELHPRALIVCFWASWCPHCRNELAALERLQRAVPAEHFRVVLVNTEPSDDWRRLRRRLEGQVSMLLTHDASEQVRKVFAAPTSVPYTVVLNRDGTVRTTFSGWGEGSLDWLIEQVNAALAVAPRQS